MSGETRNLACIEFHLHDAATGFFSHNTLIGLSVKMGPSLRLPSLWSSKTYKGPGLTPLFWLAMIVFANVVLQCQSPSYLPVRSMQVLGGDTTSIQHVLEENAFVHARTSSQLLLEAAFATKDNEYLYNDQEQALIIRSVYVLRALFHFGLWSGADGNQHFFGTASCLVRLRRPALEVATGVLHSIYLQTWQLQAVNASSTTCDTRYLLRQLVGSELEHKLWLDTGLFATGPSSACIASYRQLSEEVPTYIQDHVPLYNLLCDEIDETNGGDMYLSGNWKRRNKTFYANLKYLAQTVLGEDELEHWIEQTRRVNHALFHPNPISLAKDMTPTSLHDLLQDANTDAYFSPQASSEDVQRWHTLVHTMVTDRVLVAPFDKPHGKRDLLQAIKASRQACVDYEQGNINASDYVRIQDATRHDLQKCEREDARFAVHIPLPKDFPDFAIPNPKWSDRNAW